MESCRPLTGQSPCCRERGEGEHAVPARHCMRLTVEFPLNVALAVFLSILMSVCVFSPRMHGIIAIDEHSQ